MTTAAAPPIKSAFRTRPTAGVRRFQRRPDEQDATCLIRLRQHTVRLVLVVPGRRVDELLAALRSADDGRVDDRSFPRFCRGDENASAGV
jgi:hypothetical protein